jgi:hypothetical protein
MPQEPRTPTPEGRRLREALRDLQRWDESKGWAMFNAVLARLNSAADAVDDALDPREAAPQPDLAALRTAARNPALMSRSYRSGRVSLNADAFDDLLAAVLRLLSDANEPVAGESRE